MELLKMHLKNQYFLLKLFNGELLQNHSWMKKFVRFV